MKICLKSLLWLKMQTLHGAIVKKSRLRLLSGTFPFLYQRVHLLPYWERQDFHHSIFALTIAAFLWWVFSSCWCHFLISDLLHLWWWCDQLFRIGYLIKSSCVGTFISEVTSSVNVNKIYLKFHLLYYNKPGRGRKIIIVGSHFGRDALCTRQSPRGWICCLCNPGIFVQPIHCVQISGF